MTSTDAETSSCRGFTLLEVMIALVIVSLGMMAVHTQVNRYVAGAIYMEEKTLASWIATNRITELSVRGDWPDVGVNDDEVEFASRQWLIRTEVAETPVENIRRVDVDIYLADKPDQVVHRVSGMLEPPAPPNFPPVQWMPPVAAPGEG